MIGLLTALALQTAVPAAPAPPAPPAATVQDGGEVVVQGNRERDAATEVHRFMRGFVELEGSDPLARFSKTALCPGVTGMGAGQNAAIAARMRRVATAAGLEVDKPGCRANVLVILTPDRKAMLTWLKRERANMFERARREPVDVHDDGRASIAWQVIGMVDKWGTPINAGPGSYVNLPDGGVGSFNIVSLPDGASRLSSPVRPVVWFSAVIIDAKAIDGLTVTQLADYALMRTVAGADPDRLAKSSAATVATVLDTPVGQAAPLTLTDWDFSYLKALYAVPENQYGARQRTAMKERILRDQRKARGE